jgi:pimeloyl-ACP methyl ester carboxylesterase
VEGGASPAETDNVVRDFQPNCDCVPSVLDSGAVRHIGFSISSEHSLGVGSQGMDTTSPRLPANERGGTLRESTDDLLASLGGNVLTRRRLIQGLATVLAPAAMITEARSIGTPQESSTKSANEVPYSSPLLSPGIRSRFVNNINGLRMHVLEAGFEVKDRPRVLLLHGFPELAYSWRKVMLPIASAGFHVIAPDRRGYGRTSGWDVGYDDDLEPFGTLNQLRDMLGLVSAVGYRSVAAVVGHDQGSPLAAWCSIVRPDVFRSVVLMSAPFAGSPGLPFNSANAEHTDAAADPTVDNIYEELAALKPPRKHYQRYYATREANDNMWHASQGVHDFLRAYYHMKSADWKQNVPFPLKARTASEWAKLPRYYVMDLDKGMAETVAPEMPSVAAVHACKWLPEEELKVYSTEYGRTGFQGGLQGYRLRWIAKYTEELQLFSGRTIDVPSLFIGGKSDWGVYQNPGDFEKMQKTACTNMSGTYLVDGAGHWVQQEQPEEVSQLLIQFLRDKA